MSILNFKTLFGRRTSIRVGESLCFKGRWHSSVGLWYELEYDESAFKIRKDFRYVNPNFEEKPNCGGDEQVVTYILTTIRKGKFDVVEIENFRGHKHIIRTNEYAII